MPSPALTIDELESVWEGLANAIDQAGPDKERLFLSKLAILLANAVADDELPEVEDPSSDVLEQIAAKESRSEVRAALYRLSPRHRAVLIMWAYSDMDIRDIAAALEMSQNAVHQLLYRARAALRTQLEKAADGAACEKREGGKSHVASRQHS